MSDETLTFTPFLADADEDFLTACVHAAQDKLETLYPGKRILRADWHSILIETDSLYAPSGIESYRLGLLDDDYPALQRASDGQVITFRV